MYCHFADPSRDVHKTLLDMCLSGCDLPSRAMARNLLAEHRLSEQRYLEFSPNSGDFTSFVAVRKALEEYQLSHVRPLLKDKLAPVYARLGNVSNEVNLGPDARLGTVLDLTGLGRVYAEAKSTFKMPQFSTYEVTDPSSGTQINDFLAIQFSNPVRREAFLEAIFKALALYRRQIELRILPTWAVEWNSIVQYLDSNAPKSWLQAVGVPKDNPVWLTVISYPVSRLQSSNVKLVRPTQLDAGWYAHHFPSPPQVAPAKGGHTMFLDLCDGRQAFPPPVSEYIHEQVDFRIGDWVSGGKLLGFSVQSISGALDKQRRQHLGFLESVYGREVKAWMPDDV